MLMRRDERPAGVMPLRPTVSLIDWPQTLAARGRNTLSPGHLRHRPPVPQATRLHCFLLDSSASMRLSGGLAQAKGLLLKLMQEAYRRRDRVALLTLSGNGVQLQLSPRRAAGVNDALITPIGGGGGTPLAEGVAAADRVMRRSKVGHCSFWLLTDGRSRELPVVPRAAHALSVVDFESGRLVLGRAGVLAGQWGAGYLRFSEIGV